MAKDKLTKTCKSTLELRNSLTLNKLKAKIKKKKQHILAWVLNTRENYNNNLSRISLWAMIYDEVTHKKTGSKAVFKLNT